MKLFVPQDTVALALDADLIAARFKQLANDDGTPLEMIRNGSRGLFWLEVMVEFERNGERYAIGPVSLEDVDSVFAALKNETESHELFLGRTEEIAYLKKQTRVSFARAGIADPLDVEAYQALSGFEGLRNALQLKPQQIIDQVKQSGLRGRGGAAFPAGIKWQTVLDAKGSNKTIVCNADEGDSGTFADRLLMEADPFQLIEGMIIAGLAVGAEKGYIYLRSEYPRAEQILLSAIDRAISEGILGDNVLDSSRRFHLDLRRGAGAYICGEETSLLDSLEGKRGMVRAKPPLPAISGFMGRPTVVNNVLTLAAATTVLARGADYYSALGTESSKGSLAVQLAGNIKQGGLVELPFGVSLRELVFDYGGGSHSGRTVRAIQVGGPLGAYLNEAQWDTPMEYEAFAAIGAMLGHGGVVVFDDTVDMAEQARFAMEFCAEESCGKCTPCRIGSVRGVEVIDKIVNGDDAEKNVQLLSDLCDTMEQASLCAMGGLTPSPVRSAMTHFFEDFVKSESDRKTKQEAH